jgi:hypothetical protein
MAMQQIIRGDTLRLTAKFTGVDLTGWKWAYTLKRNLEDADDAALLKFGPTAATAGQIAAYQLDYSFPAAETLNLAPGLAWQDFQFENAAGEVSSIAAVQVEILADATVRLTA